MNNDLKNKKESKSEPYKQGLFVCLVYALIVIVTKFVFRFELDQDANPIFKFIHDIVNSQGYVLITLSILAGFAIPLSICLLREKIKSI